MTDYPLTQIDWSDPGNWYGEDVGSNFAGEATGSVDGTSAAIEFPEEPVDSTPEYTYEIVPVDLTTASIVGVRVELEVASGSGEVSWVVDVSTGSLPIIQRNNDAGTPTIGAGMHRYTLGTGYDETDDGDPVGTPWDLAAFLERLAVSDPPATPEVTGIVTLQSGGPISISAFRLVAYTATVTSGVPPRRLRQRSW